MDGNSVGRTRKTTSRQSYLVMFTTWRRDPLFNDPTLAFRACQALTDARLWYGARLLAWVLMPDHWQALVQPGPMESVDTLVHKLKSNSGRWIRVEDPAVSRVWAAGFEDHALPADSALDDIARYLIAQPIRAHLAEDVRTYPYWDSAWLQRA